MTEHLSLRQQTHQLLEQLPTASLAELKSFMGYLQFKYQSTKPSHFNQTIKVPPDSLTATYKGLVQSPLTVEVLHESYELHLTGELE